MKKFKVGDVELAVRKPTHAESQIAQRYHSKAFREAVEGGAIVRAGPEKVMREQNLWDNTKQKKYEELTKALLDGEKKLTKGGLKLKEARDIAIQMRRDRWELLGLNRDRNQLDVHTAEAQAENTRFNWLVSACTIHPDTGLPFFKNYDDYMKRAEDAVAVKAASELGNLLYGLEDNYEEKLPENAWLKKYKFVDKDLHLVNKEGKRVNTKGQEVDEEGYPVNEKGQRVDDEGNVIDKEGNYVWDEVLPFYDDEGNPVDEEGNPLKAKPLYPEVPAKEEVLV